MRGAPLSSSSQPVHPPGPGVESPRAALQSAQPPLPDPEAAEGVAAGGQQPPAKVWCLPAASEVQIQHVACEDSRVVSKKEVQFIRLRPTREPKVDHLDSLPESREGWY